MGGKNPYLKQVEVELPDRAYTVRFVASGDGRGANDTVVTVEPAKLPYGRDGLPGSLLDIALAHGVSIDHACGGVLACSTCHVKVKQGGESCNEASDAENDMLDLAPGVTPSSRLACHTVPNGRCPEVVVEVPGWNRNLVREEHH
ncbi:MAG: 2Fe-2S iron-sulfur cluster binding domain-containing protein [Planctomycetes bacterium]|nr:2Fe-2S iron-sulfur cluster binding domain-containing protein [Planctomycetota bacterium]